MSFVRVALPGPPYSTLTYQIPAWMPNKMLKHGLRIAVPLGGTGLRAGILLDFENESGVPQGVEIKELFLPLEREPLISPEYLQMVADLSARQAVSLGRVLGAVLPSGLKSAKCLLRRFAAEGGKGDILKLADLKDKEAVWLEKFCEDWLGGGVSVIPHKGALARVEFLSVCKDPPWPLRPTAKKQIELMEYLWEQGGKTRLQLRERFGAGVAQPAGALIKHGLLSVGPRPEDSYCLDIGADEDPHEAKLEQLVEKLARDEDGNGPPGSGRLFRLTSEQDRAVVRLGDMLEGGGSALLHGVTGSGKTAVYLELAARCLEKGENVLLLAPEVALACKLEREARKYLSCAEIYLSHGYQSSLKREKLFRRASMAGSPVLICGTRSSLFLPLKNLGLIVLDEEHDSSFKQDEGLIYQAKELAWYLAGQHKALLLLGSATPDVRTFQAGMENQIPVVSLEKRLNQGSLPSLKFVDIKKLGPQDCIIAPESLKDLKKTVEAGRQAIILLNRRGYSPLMYCLDCGQVVRCPNCEIGMTFHKARGRMVCHYCSHSSPFPQPCERCKGAHYLAMGEGTEKLEESLLEHMPFGCKILRLDRDTARRQGRAEEILAAFAREEAQILVGTQMLSKGHHFPKVTLAVIADGDLGLNLPDYQAAERTFQLVMQSAGRSGRGDESGEVIVQTRDPNHPCWRFIGEGDYRGFFEHEITLRKKYGYPPFSRLGLIRFSYPMNWDEGPSLINQAAQIIRKAAKELGVTALGPAPAPLASLRGMRRYQCLLKADNWPAVRGVFAELAAKIPSKSKLRLSLDIDPANML